MCSYGMCGIICILIGSFIFAYQVIYNKIVQHIHENIPLVEGSEIFKIWSSPIDLTFSCYFFNVTNPDEVMHGENPNFEEYGPFTYNEVFEKQIIDIDEETDEITYTTKSTYRFNKNLSVNATKTDKVTVLNIGYIGSMITLTLLPPDMMIKFGNSIPKLFPNSSSIFLKARPTEILFDGVRVMCNRRKFPELDMICNTMEANLPPVLRKSDKDGVYLLSVFQRLNATLRGPFSVNRGLKNITKLGNISSYKGKKVQTIWNSDDCNTVRGTDTITWAPLVKHLPFVQTFIPDLCRTIEVDYEDDVSIKGLRGLRYLMKERTWYLNQSQCYCLLVRKQPQCLPQGLIDATDCQKVPVILSEPHFLHGDPELLTYARGLKPDVNRHGTYIVIEPITGTPLAGQKMMQVNLKLTRQPVELLKNVSEGYFPILWCKNGNTPVMSVIMVTYQALRLLQVVLFIQKLPLIVGIYMILMTMLYRYLTKHKVKPATFADTILISSNPRSDNVAQRSA